MTMRLRWLPVFARVALVALVALVAIAPATVQAAPLDFTGQPVFCTDPAGATVPVPCAATVVPRADGYSLIGYSFNFIIPPPPPAPPPPPFPAVAQNDSMRDFFNPVMQDIFVWIFGETKIDVDGAPVLFFVQGTLDGTVVASFTQAVAGHDNHVSWNTAGVVDDVAPGLHTLDMHFGIIQLVPLQPSQVNVASLYRVTASALPEPGALVLVLGAIGLAAATRQRRPQRA